LTASSNESTHRKQLPTINKKPSQELGIDDEPRKPTKEERSIDNPLITNKTEKDDLITVTTKQTSNKKPK
jgi:hypothetical protein